jgi:GNAT superfamily N-acetyltransferase
MRLANGLTNVPAGKLATVVTYLEMTSRPRDADLPSGNWTIERREHPSPSWYRDLYRRIGQDWLWFTRLTMADEQLEPLIHRPGVEIYYLNFEGNAEGLLELQFENNSCELVFFGVTEKVRPMKAARHLMDFAMDVVWSKPIQKLLVHTCTMDHPNALPFYIRSGFRPIQRRVEVMDDPRIDGLVPKQSAPHIPIITG